MAAAARTPDFTTEFVTLCETQRGKLTRLAASVMRTRCTDEAEDVVQTALMKAWEHRDQFGGFSSLSTWLARIVFNEAKAHLRRRNPLHFAAGNDSLPEIPVVADQEIQAFNQERLDLLREVLSQMTEAQREALERWANGTMRLENSSDKVRALRVRRKLQKAIGSA